MLLPGHLLLKFLKEQLETALDMFRTQVCIGVAVIADKWADMGSSPGMDC